MTPPLKNYIIDRNCKTTLAFFTGFSARYLSEIFLAVSSSNPNMNANQYKSQNYKTGLLLSKKIFVK
jgi:hypothetical protein